MNARGKTCSSPFPLLWSALMMLNKGEEREKKNLRVNIEHEGLGKFEMLGNCSVYGHLKLGERLNWERPGSCSFKVFFFCVFENKKRVHLNQGFHVFVWLCLFSFFFFFFFSLFLFLCFENSNVLNSSTDPTGSQLFTKNNKIKKIKNWKKKKKLQHTVFPRRLRPQYWQCHQKFDFGDRTGSGTFFCVWP